jgi:flagellum-specific peptidoglycan hydrolase FlgJ
VALQVSKEIGVDPNLLLSQWGLESRWGQSEMAKTHNNVGGIKDFSGHGHEARAEAQQGGWGVSRCSTRRLSVAGG